MSESEEGKTALQELFEALSKQKLEWKIGDEIQYPLTIESVENGIPMRPMPYPPGQPVAVRPCGDNPENKTYFGIYLGDLPTGQSTVAYHIASKKLRLALETNPCIFVPDLGRIVWGMESWWDPIEDEAGMKEITDDVVTNVWYVRAINALGERMKAAEETIKAEQAAPPQSPAPEAAS